MQRGSSSDFAAVAVAGGGGDDDGRSCAKQSFEIRGEFVAGQRLTERPNTEMSIMSSRRRLLKPLPRRVQRRRLRRPRGRPYSFSVCGAQKRSDDTKQTQKQTLPFDFGVPPRLGPGESISTDATGSSGSSPRRSCKATATQTTLKQRSRRMILSFSSQKERRNPCMQSASTLPPAVAGLSCATLSTTCFSASFFVRQGCEKA